MQVRALVYQVPPEPLDEDIIEEPPLSVHLVRMPVRHRGSVQQPEVNWLPF
jgi:hypothetical protein